MNKTAIGKTHAIIEQYLGKSITLKDFKEEFQKLLSNTNLQHQDDDLALLNDIWEWAVGVEENKKIREKLTDLITEEKFRIELMKFKLLIETRAEFRKKNK